jgi:hypothetical protein
MRGKRDRRREKDKEQQEENGKKRRNEKREDTHERVRYLEERIRLTKHIAAITDSSGSLSYRQVTFGSRPNYCTIF